MSTGLTTSENFKKLREAVGISQHELAAILKIKRSLVAAYEEKRAAVSSRVIHECIKNDFLLKGQLFDFMFNKKWEPTPKKRYKKMLVEV